MFILKLSMKVFLLPVMLVLIVLQVFLGSRQRCFLLLLDF